MKIAISWLFFIYFAVLGTERVRSLFPIGDGGLFPTAFDGYVNLMTVLSLLATVVLLIGFNGGFWRSLFGGATPDYRMLVITAGVLLLSGMVHTEHTVAPVQFGSYGALILAMVLQTVLQVRSVGSAASHWFSLAYLVAFSMAIPVVYRSSIPRAGLFHVIEAVTAIVLVVFFTYLTLLIFRGEGKNLLLWAPFLVMLAADTVILLMRRQETLNTFVLVAGGLATVLFIIGKILLPRLP